MQSPVEKRRSMNLLCDCQAVRPIVALLVVFLSSACVAKQVLWRESTIQKQCRVTDSTGVTQGQALCLASRFGVPEKGEPWSLLQTDSTWWVCTDSDEPVAWTAVTSVLDGEVTFTRRACPEELSWPAMRLRRADSTHMSFENSKAPSIQRLCGIRPKRGPVNVDQARCLARVVAGPLTVQEWTITEQPDAWSVVGTIRKSANGCGDESYELAVEKLDGTIRYAQHTASMCAS